MDAVELLQALVRIPSPNPTGDTRQIAAFIASFLHEAGAQVISVAPPNKPEAVSVIASVGSGEPMIMLHAHIDTVPIAASEADRWRFEPYSATIDDGKLYGKGSIDDKAPLAAMMTVMREVAQAEAGHGTLILVAAAEEETGGTLGTRWLADNAYLPSCDFIVVGEQTANRVAVAHKGVMRATITATGKSVHATNPDRGVNAITALARVVLALDAYHRDLRARVHPLVGSPTCNVGVIQGGSTANAVPDRCTIHIDRRMIPRESPEAVQREIEAVLASVDVGEADISISDYLFSSWFDSTVDSPLARTFLACVGEVLKIDPTPIGYLPGSDAKHLMQQMRGEMIIFGPGSYEVAHAFDEHVELEAFAATVEILRRFLQNTLFAHKET